MWDECKEEVHAVMNSSFSAVKKKQISGHRGEKVIFVELKKFTNYYLTKFN